MVVSSDPSALASRNRLLAALPLDSLARLWPWLVPVELEMRQILHSWDATT
jgi:hypothetical protein